MYHPTVAPNRCCASQVTWASMEASCLFSEASRDHVNIIYLVARNILSDTRPIEEAHKASGIGETVNIYRDCFVRIKLLERLCFSRNLKLK